MARGTEPLCARQAWRALLRKKRCGERNRTVTLAPSSNPALRWRTQLAYSPPANRCHIWFIPWPWKGQIRAAKTSTQPCPLSPPYCQKVQGSWETGLDPQGSSHIDLCQRCHGYSISCALSQVQGTQGQVRSNKVPSCVFPCKKASVRMGGEGMGKTQPFPWCEDGR